MRQARHFLGHVLTTPGPDEQSAVSEKQRTELFGLLGRASDLYPFLFIPRPEEFRSLDPEERLRYAAAGPAFISHFFQGSLSTTDQVLNRTEIAGAIPICVTADSWGIFATDISVLLEKKAGDPWPWAAWIFDLEVFLEALQLQGQDPGAFVSFLQQRVELHGRLGTSDELEICGMYVKHGRLPQVSEGALLQPIPEYADIFDEIYFWKQGLRDKPDLAISPEIYHADTTQLARKGAMAMARAATALDSVPRNVGRNDPCPCGSGRKFKRCHGSPTGRP